MIVVDSSALLAVVLGEPAGSACLERLAGESDVAIAAGTLAEALIVAGRRGVRADVERLIRGLSFDVAPLTADGATRVADAYARWGKGNHAAGLNYGDCFAYALAQERGCPLLFVGGDFGRTDVAIAQP